MAYGSNNCDTDVRTVRSQGSGETLGVPTSNDNMKWNTVGSEIQVKSLVAGSGCTITTTDTELKLTFSATLYDILGNTSVLSACGEAIDIEKVYGCSATGLFLLNNRSDSAGVFIQDATGNVGIGTIAPTAKLQVSGSSIFGGDAAHSITFNASSAAVPNGLTFGAKTLVLDESNGRVGVGVGSPTVELDVKGRIRLGSASNLVIADGKISTASSGGLTLSAAANIVLDAGGGNVIIKDNASTFLNIENSAATNVSLDAPGSITLDTSAGTVFLKKNSVRSLKIESDASSNIVFKAPTDIHLATSGGNVLIKDSSTSQATIFDFNADSPSLTIYDDSVHADKFQIHVNANASTTLQTTDTAGQSGDIILDADGDVILDAIAGNVTLKKDGSTIVDVVLSDSAAVFDATHDIVLDAAGANVKFKSNSAAMFDFDIANNSMQIMHSADTGDMFKVQVVSAGATTISTIDDDGVNANLTLDVDGDIILDADGGNVTFKDDGTTIFDIAFNGASNFTVDAPGDVIVDVGGGDLTLKKNGTIFGSLTENSNELIIKSGTTPTTAITMTGANVAIAGNLTVNGTTTTINSTTKTIDDPIVTLGGDTAPGSDDNKDRGVEFRYHDGSAAQIGFFGYDDNLKVFTVFTSATNSSEVFSGTTGDALFDQVTLSTLAASGDLTLDAGGDIILDADGANVLIKDNGTTTLDITNSGASAVVFDAPGQIVLDVAQGNVLVKNNGSAANIMLDPVNSKIHIKNTTSAGGYILFGDSGGSPGLRLGSHGGIEFKNSGGAWANVVPASAAIIGATNGADNRLATFTSAAGLNGEANLTFDGTDATIAGAGKLQFRDANSYIHSNDSNDMTVVATDFTLDVAGDITLDADGGNVLIKDGAAGTILDITNSGASSVIFDAPGNIVLDTPVANSVMIKTNGSAAILNIENSGPAAVIFDAPHDIVFDINSTSGLVFKHQNSAAQLKIYHQEAEKGIVFDAATTILMDTSAGELEILHNGSAASAIIADVKNRKLRLQGSSSAGGYLLFGHSAAAPGLRKGSAGHIQFRTTHGGQWQNIYNSAAGVNQANAANNRVVTSVDATNVNAEANLTFDGTDLLVNGTGKVAVGDTATYIHQSQDSVLTAVADGNIVLDAGGDIELNADGANVVVKDGNTTVVDITNSGANSVIFDAPGKIVLDSSDGDILLKKDGTRKFRFNTSKNRFHLPDTASAGGYILWGNSAGSAAGFRLSSVGAIQFRNSGGAWTNIYNSATGVSLSNDANNRVTTAKGDGDINAEANLTFDGTDLLINGTGKVAVGDTATYIHQSQDSVLTAVADGNIVLDAGGDIELNADGANVTIKDGSAVVVDITNSAGSTSVIFDAPGNIVLDANGGQVVIKDDGAQHFTFDADNTQLTIWDDTDSADYLRFTVAANGVSTIATNDNNGTVGHLTLDADGDIELNADGGNITMKDAGSTLFTFAANEIDVASGNLLIDVAGDINLDADGGNIYFKDAGSAGMYFNVAEAKIHIAAGAHTGATSAGGYLLFGTSAGSPGLRLGSAGHIQFKTTHGGVWSKIYNSATGGGVSLSNDANNRITTAKGDGDINAEANLLFDGTDLLINSTGKLQVGDTGTYIHQSGDAVLDVVSDGNIVLNATLDIELNADGANVTIKDDSATVIDFANSGGSEAVIFDAPGDIHLDADGGLVIIKDNGAPHFTFDADNTQLTIWDDTDDDDYLRFTVAANGVSTIATNDNNGTVGHLTLDVDGDIELNADGGAVTVKDASQLMLDITHSGAASTTLMAGTNRLYLATSTAGARTIVDSHGGLLTPQMAIGRHLEQTRYGLSLSGSAGNESGTQEIVGYNAANSTGAVLEFKRTRGGVDFTSAGSIVQADDILGHLKFKGSDGTSAAEFGSIIFRADGGTSAAASPGKFELRLTASGTKSQTKKVLEVMEDGVIKVPTPNPGGFRRATATAAAIDIQTTQSITTDGRSFKMSITTHGNLDAGTRTVEISVSNDKILGADDLVIMSPSNANANGIMPHIYNVATGGFKLRLSNQSGQTLNNDTLLVYRGMVFNDGT